MIYVDQNSAQEGRTKYWRIFADTGEELREAMKAAKISTGHLVHTGEPNEHAYVSTTNMKKFKGTQTIGMRDLVALIRSKRAFPDDPPECPIQELPEAEPVKRGGVTILAKPDPVRYTTHDEDDQQDYPDEAAEE